MVKLTDHTMIGKQYWYFKPKWNHFWLIECTHMDYAHKSNIEGKVIVSYTDTTKQDTGIHVFMLDLLYELDDTQTLVKKVFK